MILRQLIPLITGLPGFIAAHLLAFPLPSLLGPMIVNAVLCLSGFKMKISNRFLIPVFVVIGWQLGGRFTPDIWLHFSQWLLASLFLTVWIALSTLLGAYYLIWVAKYDRITAIYASLPGALASIVSFLQEVPANQRQVIIAQTVRVFTVVGVLPIGFAFFLTAPSLTTIDIPQTLITHNLRQELIGWLAMIVSSSLVIPLLYLLRVPSSHLLGSTIVAAVFYSQGWLSVPLPNIVLFIALYVLGCVIGSRFSGSSWWELTHIGKHGIAVSLLLLVFSAIGGLLCAYWLDLDIFGILLAFVPGGVHEMTIMAFAYDTEPILVAFLHLVRLIVIILSLPLLAILLRRIGK